MEKKELFGFGEALEKLEQGRAVTSVCRKGSFIYKQIPAEITVEIIPRMTSTPQIVKDIMLSRGRSLKFRNQLAIVDPEGYAESWSPSIADAYATDYYIYTG